jgi:hypothetical protein
MKAIEALDGGRYQLPKSHPRHHIGILECVGWNHTHEWLLFVYYDAQKRRKTTMLFPSEELEAL